MQIELRARENGAEYALFTPELSVRPHHLIQLQSIRAALNRRRDPQIISEEFMKHTQITKMTQIIPGYAEGIMGTTAEEAEKTREGVEAYFQRLYNLSDDAFIQLDPSEDDLCKSCINDQHCTATNFQAIEPGTRLVDELERNYIFRIRGDLERAGYKEDKDFRTKGTKHTLFDYNGEILSDEAISTPREVLFDALIVRVGALRDLY